MKLHHYKTQLDWTGNLGEGTKSYSSYKRAHQGSAPSKSIIELSSDPSFKGDPSKHNPEELLVISLSSCHMLWYLHLCSVNKITVVAYEDAAEGVMEEGSDGAGKFNEVTLKPTVTILESEKVKLAESLHEQANKMCFIANSCNFPVLHQAEIRV